MTEPDRIDGLTTITTYVPDGLAQIYDQVRPSDFNPAALTASPPGSVTISSDRPVLAALLGAWLLEGQAFESASWQVEQESLDGTFGTAATGVGLDVIGRILGFARAGASDDVYRTRLKGWIRVLKSAGNPEDLNGIAGAMLPPTVTVSVTTMADSTTPLGATVLVRVTGALTDDTVAAEAELFLQDGAGIGVRVMLAYSHAAPVNTFTWGDCTAPDPSRPASQRWGDSASPGSGGVWASVID